MMIPIDRGGGGYSHRRAEIPGTGSRSETGSGGRWNETAVAVVSAKANSSPKERVRNGQGLWTGRWSWLCRGKQVPHRAWRPVRN